MLNWTKERFEKVEEKISKLDAERRLHYGWIRDRTDQWRYVEGELSNLKRDFKLLMERLDLVFEDEPARRVIRKVGS